MLDRRLGRRRLQSLDLGGDAYNLVGELYRLRCEATGGSAGLVSKSALMSSEHSEALLKA